MPGTIGAMRGVDACKAENADGEAEAAGIGIDACVARDEGLASVAGAATTGPVTGRFSFIRHSFSRRWFSWSVIGM